MFSRPLKEGDVLNRNGYTQEVLGRAGKAIFLSRADINNAASDATYTEKELYQMGYRLLEDTKPWVPKVGEEYWFVDDEGDIQHTRYDADTCDLHRQDFIGIFETKPEAIAARDKVKELLKSLKDK